MEYKQAKRRFYSWLQKKGAYEQYKRNRHIANNSPFNWGYRNHFDSPAGFISMAFDWVIHQKVIDSGVNYMKNG